MCECVTIKRRKYIQVASVNEETEITVQTFMLTIIYSFNLRPLSDVEIKSILEGEECYIFTQNELHRMFLS